MLLRLSPTRHVSGRIDTSALQRKAATPGKKAGTVTSALTMLATRCLSKNRGQLKNLFRVRTATYSLSGHINASICKHLPNPVETDAFLFQAQPLAKAIGA